MLFSAQLLSLSSPSKQLHVIVLSIELPAALRGTSVKNKKVFSVYEFFPFQFPIFDSEGF